MIDAEALYDEVCEDREELRKALLHVLDDLRENKYMHGATCTARRMEPCDCGLYEIEQYINDVLGGNVLDKSLRETDVEKARDRAVMHGTEQESLYYREMTRAEEAETERDRLRQVIIEINSLESQARSGDAGALLEAEAKKAREAPVVHERLAAAGTAFIRFAQHRPTCACITEGVCDCGLTEALGLFTSTGPNDD